MKRLAWTGRNQAIDTPYLSVVYSPRPAKASHAAGLRTEERTQTMNRIQAALATAVPALLLAAGSAGADSVGRPRPGYWELTNVFTVVITQKKVERRCLVASEIQKFMTSPSNRHYACTYPSRAVGDGKILLKGSCATKEGQVADVTANGGYAPESFRLKLSLSTKIAGIPLAGTATTTARRLGDACPADAVRSDEAKRVLKGGDTPPQS